MATKLQIWNRAARAAGDTQRIESVADTRPTAAACADAYDDYVREVLAAREWPWAIAQAPLTEIGEQSVSYTGNDAQVAFTVSYDIGDASQIKVTVNSVELVLGTHYAFTPPTDDFSATVTFLVAPANGSAITLTVMTTRVGWDFVFSYPSNCVRPLALLHEGERRSRLPQAQRVPFVVVPNNSLTGYVVCADADDFEVLEYVALITEESMYPPHFAEALVRRIAAHLLDAVKKAPREAAVMMESYYQQVGIAHAVANNSGGQPEQVESPALVARGFSSFWGRR